MKCYNHHDTDAVGVCKSCSKGLCPECATEIGLSLACKETCREEVALLDEQIRRSRVTIAAQKNNRMYMPAFFLVFGAILIGMTLYKFGAVDIRILPGIVFMIFGFILLFINSKWVKDMDAKYSKREENDAR